MTIKLVGKNMKIIPYNRIGGIIPKNCLTLVTGLPATGKSFTVLKFLNHYGIQPYLFNLDYDPTLQTFDLIGSTAEPEALKAFLDGEVEDLDNQVIVIDTYTRLVSDLGIDHTEANQRLLVNKLLKLCREKGYTILVIGHVEQYATKSNIFKDNQYLVRDSHEHLHFDKLEVKDKKTGNVSFEYRTTFVKNRGNSIPNPIIDNWMR